MAKKKILDSRGKPRVQTVNNGPSLTVQSDAHLTDVNNILARYGAEGLKMLDETALKFADVSEFTDLSDALNQAKQAEIEFRKLDPRIRSIFDNDVAVWLDTSHDKDKRDALVEAGVLKAVEKVPPLVETTSETGTVETPAETGGSAA